MWFCLAMAIVYISIYTYTFVHSRDGIRFAKEFKIIFTPRFYCKWWNGSICNLHINLMTLFFALGLYFGISLQQRECSIWYSIWNVMYSMCKTRTKGFVLFGSRIDDDDMTYIWLHSLFLFCSNQNIDITIEMWFTVFLYEFMLCIVFVRWVGNVLCTFMRYTHVLNEMIDSVLIYIWLF